MLGHSVFVFGAPPLAYVGLGPGQEFIPYFFALLGVVGAALVAALQRPVALVLRFLCRARDRALGRPDVRPAAVPAAAEAEAVRTTGEVGDGQPFAAGLAEEAVEGTHDQP